MPTSPDSERKKTVRAPKGAGHVAKISAFFANFRWFFMPAGLFALVAVGVHAAADVLDDHVLRLFDQLDKVLDSLWGANSLTQPLVDWVGAEQRTVAARALMLLWELVADLLLAFPVLGYAEEAHPKPGKKKFLPVESRRFPVLAQRIKQRPTTLRLFRPIATGAMAVAGACAVARMVQGALYLSMHQGIADRFAGPIARLFAVLALVGVLISFGWRAVLQSLADADETSELKGLIGRRALTTGLWCSVLLLPLTVCAVMDASPLWAFFR
ncbi:MAG: hypothetical protein ACT4TC_24680 [Myxococcaceae bacterium]